MFSYDVTAAIFAFQNNEMAAMLVYQTNPVGAELFPYVRTGDYLAPGGGEGGLKVFCPATAVIGTKIYNLYVSFGLTIHGLSEVQLVIGLRF